MDVNDGKASGIRIGRRGARGALQVGAFHSLFEAGYQPDLLVRTSIGAANATCLGFWGVNMDGVAAFQLLILFMYGVQSLMKITTLTGSQWIIAAFLRIFWLESKKGITHKK